METVTLALILTLATLTTAYPSGAPSSACRQLLPRHRGTATRGNVSSFEIGVDSIEYSPNSPITVTIHNRLGSSNFMAFLLQARVKGTDKSVGQFKDLPQYTKTLQCFAPADSVTHSAAVSRDMIQVTWVAPAEDVGDIEILGSVAESKLVYWGVLSSGPLSFSPGMDSSTSPTDLTAPTHPTRSTHPTHSATPNTVPMGPDGKPKSSGPETFSAFTSMTTTILMSVGVVVRHVITDVELGL